MTMPKNDPIDLHTIIQLYEARFHAATTDLRRSRLAKLWTAAERRFDALVMSQVEPYQEIEA